MTTSTQRAATGNATSTVARRLIAGCVAAACAGLLGLAAWLTPSSTGLGTHQELRLPPCGWITIMDIPCPTCGMTTAFAHAAHGHLWASFLAQPMGCILAIITAMALLVSLQVMLTGSRLGWAFARLWGRRSGWIIAGMVFLAWMFKLCSYKGWIG